MEAALGYAADDRGYGVSYARLRDARGEHLLRVPFRVRAHFGAPEVAYAALIAVAKTLHRRGVIRARFVLEDEGLVADVTQQGALSAAMVLPYVRLKCALNQFEAVSLVAAQTLDLTQRARAEIALNSVA
ncbi:MAG: hypothetical protein JO302_04055 [Candidatus Eremiobacteraeota bacterium]|nr:hypothetical protein [Candidatus Eremiobacteraeota bacterium]